MKLDKSQMLLGIGMIMVGIFVYTDGWSYKYDQPVPKFSGIVVAIFGILLICYEVLRKFIKKRNNNKVHTGSNETG